MRRLRCNAPSVMELSNLSLTSPGALVLRSPSFSVAFAASARLACLPATACVLHQEPEGLESLKMEVGIEDCLHIEFEYDKSAYHLQDVVIGKVRRNGDLHAHKCPWERPRHDLSTTASCRDEVSRVSLERLVERGATSGSPLMTGCSARGAELLEAWQAKHR